MTIRVDSCVTFGIRKFVTKSVQFHSKLLINRDLVQCVKTGASFRYLGRHFDFEMSNGEHKTELMALVTGTMSQIDYLPLHPKNKILLYNHYMLAKISRHLTVADLSKT